MISEEQGRALVATMQEGWNAGDGGRYAEAFADDADFVTVAGMYASGREAIAANHDRIFATVYKDSRVTMQVTRFRPIDDQVALMHVSATLEVPAGPFAGSMDALMTTVIANFDGEPRITALHNTIVRDLAQAAGRSEQGKEAKQ